MHSYSFLTHFGSSSCGHLSVVPVVVDLACSLLLRVAVHLRHGIRHHDAEGLGHGEVLDAPFDDAFALAISVRKTLLKHC